jgi:hypothetical protein
MTMGQNSSLRDCNRTRLKHHICGNTPIPFHASRYLANWLESTLVLLNIISLINVSVA